MRFFDTFSGIGGFSLPLTELRHECVGTRVHSCQRGTYAARKFASHVYLLHYTPTRLSEQRRIIAMNLDKRRTRLYRRSVFGLG